MAKLKPSDSPQLATELPALKTTSVAHPDTWNPIHQLLLDSVAYLDLSDKDKERALQSIEQRVNEVESSSSVAIERAVRADWNYRDNRIAHELWATGFTLIDAQPVQVLQAIVGDDSIDVSDTTHIKRGEFYVLSVEEPSTLSDGEDPGDEGRTVRELVQCTAILSENRIRVSRNLTQGFDGGVLSRCSFEIVGSAFANAVDGDIWLSKKINIGASAAGGAVVVRRTLNSTVATLYYRDAEHDDWQGRNWSHRRQGGDIPAGFADYEYSLPMRGEGNLRLDISDGDATVVQIVAIAAPTGLGGFVNPEMRPTAPAILSPENGAVNVSETPTVSIVSYDSPGDTPQKGIRFQFSTDAQFGSVLHDTGMMGAGLSYSAPEKVLPEGAEIYVRPMVSDTAGLESDWGEATSFSTMDSYAYVRSPVVVSPANGAIDVAETPHIATDLYAVVGDGVEPQQIATQYQIRQLSGGWDSPTWDSGRDTSNLTGVDLPAGILRGGKRQYAIRVRKEDATLGWSDWSAESRFTTKDVFANIIGIAMKSAGKNGGEWQYVDAEGNPLFIPGGAFFDNHPIWGGIIDVVIDGQAMVKIPKFHTKTGHVTLPGVSDPVPCWWISDQPVAGFETYPAFFHEGVEINQFYVGKYQASLAESKMASRRGVMPVVSRGIAQCIADAKARNTNGVTGFMLWSLYQWSAIQWLYLLENATMDSQNKTGQGRVLASTVANVDAFDVATATYRGIVGLWGNVRQQIDGLKTENGFIHVWDRRGYKRWVKTEKKRSAANRTIYPVTFMLDKGLVNDYGYDFADHFIGNTGLTDNTNATAPDYQEFMSTGNDYPAVGGGYSHADRSGLWGLYIGGDINAISNSRGSRLSKE